MSAPPPKKMGLSLYANLLDADKQKSTAGGATISGAPVRYDTKRQEEEALKKKDGTVT